MSACPKNCDLDLTALAAGDLPRWRAIRLRRHLRSCADCAATYASIETIFSQACSIPYSLSALSGDLQHRTWAQIAAKPATRSPTVRSPKRRALVVGLVGGTVAAGAVAAAILLPPGAPLAPTPSFAMVAKAMADAQSLEFHMVDTTDYGKPSRRIVEDTRIALRLNPPTIAMVHGDSQYFTHSDEKVSYGGTGNLWDGKPEFYVTPTRSVATLQKVIRGSMSFKSGQPGLGMAFQWSAAKRVRLDGQQALRFDGTGGSEWVRKDAYYHPWNATVWVDPTTLRFLRYETSQRINDSITQRSVASEYVYNQTDTHSILTKSPPVRTPIALLSEIFAPATAAEGQDARVVVGAALSAWARRERDQFATYCDKGEPVWNHPIAFTSRQPLDVRMPAATWKRLVEMQSYQPSSEIRSVTTTAIYTLVRQSTQEPVPSQLPNNVLVVRTNNATFYLKQTSNAGLKIFHVTCMGKPASKPGESRAVVSWP